MCLVKILTISSIIVVWFTRNISAIEWNCTRNSRYAAKDLRPSYTICHVSDIDLTKKLEEEKFIFSGSEEQKKSLQNITAVGFNGILKIDFIPLQILEEFPNLNGLSIAETDMYIIRDSLFTVEHSMIEYLSITYTKLELIEENAFQHLKNLKWISLKFNNIKSLSRKFFAHNPQLEFMDFNANPIKMIDPQTFTNLKELKVISFTGNNYCIKQRKFGCEHNRGFCTVDEPLLDHKQLNDELQSCYSKFSSNEDLLKDTKNSCSKVVVNRVYDGIKVDERLYPWAVAFHHNERFKCGGSLISNRHVLFAAHCLIDKDEFEVKKPESCYFFFGNDLTVIEEADKMKTSEFFIHPDWETDTQRRYADLAIALLVNPVKFSDDVFHVCLNSPLNPVDSFAGNNATVVGWGFTEFSSATPVKHLREVAVPFVDQSFCNSSHIFVWLINSDTSFCAGAKDGKSGACVGDSGGGIVYRINGNWKLIGIISASLYDPETFCDLENYALFTDVSKFIYWIDQIMLETIIDYVQ